MSQRKRPRDELLEHILRGMRDPKSARRILALQKSLRSLVTEEAWRSFLSIESAMVDRFNRQLEAVVDKLSGVRPLGRRIVSRR